MNADIKNLGSLGESVSGSLSGLLGIVLTLSKGSVFGGSTVGDLGSSISFS